MKIFTQGNVVAPDLGMVKLLLANCGINEWGMLHADSLEILCRPSIVHVLNAFSLCAQYLLSSHCGSPVATPNLQYS